MEPVVSTQECDFLWLNTRGPARRWTLREDSELVLEQATSNSLNGGEDYQGRRRYGLTTQVCRTRVDILLVVTSQIVRSRAPFRGLAMGD